MNFHRFMNDKKVEEAIENEEEYILDTIASALSSGYNDVRIVGNKIFIPTSKGKMKLTLSR